MNTASAASQHVEQKLSRRTILSDGEAKVTTRSLAAGATDRWSRIPEIAQAPVSAVMTADVICVSPDLSLDALVRLFVERGISGAPVVDEEGRPLGMVSKTDLVRRRHELGDTSESVPELELESGFHLQASDATVSSCMLPVAFTLGANAPLAHAAALMAWEGVHRVPVCSDSGDVIGIVTALDLVRWLADAAGYTPRRSSSTDE